jgi:hypothetical protein
VVRFRWDFYERVHSLMPAVGFVPTGQDEVEVYYWDDGMLMSVTYAGHIVRHIAS